MNSRQNNGAQLRTTACTMAVKIVGKTDVSFVPFKARVAPTSSAVAPAMRRSVSLRASSTRPASGRTASVAFMAVMCHCVRCASSLKGTSTEQVDTCAANVVLDLCLQPITRVAQLTHCCCPACFAQTDDTALLYVLLLLTRPIIANHATSRKPSTKIQSNVQFITTLVKQMITYMT